MNRVEKSALVLLSTIRVDTQLLGCALCGWDFSELNSWGVFESPGFVVGL